MESQIDSSLFGQAYEVEAPAGGTSCLLLCEHASNRVPAFLDDLGLGGEVLTSHVAWDPGALGVARALRRHLSGVLVSGTISRLVYDCNRPPEAASAIPARSEIYDIPGNTGLSAAQRQARIDNVYAPFAGAVSEVIARYRGTLKLLVTVHSFTPVFHGQKRAVEIGILHGRDDRFARAMMAALPAGTPYEIRLNEPYSARDGVAHSLDLHGAGQGLPSVMIEIRNDLIRTGQDQEAMAGYLAGWITGTLAQMPGAGGPS